MDDKFRFDWVVVDKLDKPRGRHRQDQPPGSPAARPSGTGTGTGFPGADLVAAPRPPRSEKMTVAEAHEEARTGKVTLVDMPIRLIAPARRAEGVTAAPPDVSWGVRDLGADGLRDGGRDVVVAVLDTGIDETHEAFRGVELVRRDFTGEGLKDRDGHGTHCAGTIFGRDVGGVRIGVATGVRKALIGKVLGGETGGTTSLLVQALHWALSNGADVVSMSLGMDFPGYLEHLVIRGLPPRRAASIALEAYRVNLEMFNKLSTAVVGVPGLVQGAIVVVAAGNESALPDYSIAASLPAAAAEFVSVAALSPAAAGAYALAPFSNVRAKLGAPGVAIWSAKPGGELAAMDGTSMAAPHVAGAACLWLEHTLKAQQAASAPDVIAAMRASATRLDPGIAREDIQWGRVVAPAP